MASERVVDVVTICVLQYGLSLLEFPPKPVFG